MVNLNTVETVLRSKISASEVQIRDLTGTGDHLEALVVAAAFTGKSKVQQHQMVYGALKAELASEAIHALALKTFTPEAWQAASQSK
ncbi:MAG: BolA family transcriptional regulator [Cyanobacteria bacterium P01_H01_bin.15]